MPIKEIPREPLAPKMNDEVIELLTNLCFRKNDVLPIDSELLFVFGSISCLASMTCELTEIITNKKIKKLIITGGINPNSSRKLYRPESDIILEQINHLIDEKIIVITEDSSTNSLENVENTLKLYNFPPNSSLCFVHKYHAAGRGFLTLKKFLPTLEIKQRAFPAKKCLPETWFENENFKKLVWGEFLRIKTYGERGDIAFSEKEKIVVQKIEEKISTLN